MSDKPSLENVNTAFETIKTLLTYGMFQAQHFDAVQGSIKFLGEFLEQIASSQIVDEAAGETKE